VLHFTQIIYLNFTKLSVRNCSTPEAFNGELADGKKAGGELAKCERVDGVTAIGEPANGELVDNKAVGDPSDGELASQR
jgi:hypothetical protein